MSTSRMAILLIPLLVASGCTNVGDDGETIQDIRTASSLEELKDFLDVEDPQALRMVVLRIARFDNAESNSLLLDLWGEASSTPPTSRSPISNAVVRLALAQSLVSSVGNHELVTYIKSEAANDDWIVQAAAAEALASVDDAEAVSLLRHLAESPHDPVARAAIASLLDIVRFGQSFRDAQSALESLTPIAPSLGDAVRRDHATALNEARVTADERNEFEGGVSILIPGPPPFDIADLAARAESGDIEAQHILGEAYLVGIAVDIDYPRAYQWLRLAAIDGDYAPAKFSLAQMYLFGHGVTEDRDLGLRLLRDAASRGYLPAVQLLERLERQDD